MMGLVIDFLVINDFRQSYRKKQTDTKIDSDVEKWEAAKFKVFDILWLKLFSLKTTPTIHRHSPDGVTLRGGRHVKLCPT